MYEQLSGLYHENGEKVVTIYGQHHLKDKNKQGPIVTFNLKRNNGEYVGYHEVEQLATLNNIHIRVSFPRNFITKNFSCQNLQ